MTTTCRPRETTTRYWSDQHDRVDRVVAETAATGRVVPEAAEGQVLVTQPVYAAVEMLVEAELVGDLELKGIFEPIRVYNILCLK